MNPTPLKNESHASAATTPAVPERLARHLAYQPNNGLLTG
jgi:hypothetical protein